MCDCVRETTFACMFVIEKNRGCVVYETEIETNIERECVCYFFEKETDIVSVFEKRERKRDRGL